MLKVNIKHFPIGRNPVHINYRLHGSIPKTQGETETHRRKVACEKLYIESLKLPKHLRAEMERRELFKINGKYEMALDRLLDAKTSGPFHLQKKEFRKIVLDSWENMHLRNVIFVIAICVMGNHVHAIVKAPDDVDVVMPGALMNVHKGFTARLCNLELGKTGQPFWDQHYFDREIRAGKFEAAVWYVLNNPVKAGLVKHWKDWPGTYLNPDYALLFE